MNKRAAIPRAQVTFMHSVDVDTLVESAVKSLSFDEIHDLIVKLDKACEDWGVTENLYTYFAGEMEKCPKDGAEAQ